MGDTVSTLPHGRVGRNRKLAVMSHVIRVEGLARAIDLSFRAGPEARMPQLRREESA
jgi:hypothetical protein